MPRFSLLLSCFVAIAPGLLVAVGPAAAADDAAEGWIEMFNGRDLTGWQANPEHPESFRVEDGVLVVEIGRASCRERV